MLLCASRSYSYMIDNVILLITGTRHQRSIAELVPKCHPLAVFEQMEAATPDRHLPSLYNVLFWVGHALGEWPWRMRRGGSGINVSASRGFLDPWGSPEPESEAHPWLLTFSSCQIRLPSLSSSLLFCSLPAAFTGPVTTPRPDSDHLNCGIWLIFQNAEEGRACGAWVPGVLGALDRPWP